MKKYTAEELKEILIKHEKWANDEEGGERADLRGADLRWADLRWAKLRGADLREANLRGADLREADLTGADLREADLTLAKLDEEYREEGLLEKVAECALATDASLEMEKWHSCETTHGIAGWACHLSPKGKELEEKYDPQIAGLMLLGPEAHRHFFDSNENAKVYLQGVLERKKAGENVAG